MPRIEIKVAAPVKIVIDQVGTSPVFVTITPDDEPPAIVSQGDGLCHWPIGRSHSPICGHRANAYTTSIIPSRVTCPNCQMYPEYLAACHAKN